MGSCRGEGNHVNKWITTNNGIEEQFSDSFMWFVCFFCLFSCSLGGKKFVWRGVNNGLMDWRKGTDTRDRIDDRAEERIEGLNLLIKWIDRYWVGWTNWGIDFGGLEYIFRYIFKYLEFKLSFPLIVAKLAAISPTLPCLFVYAFSSIVKVRYPYPNPYTWVSPTPLHTHRLV